MPYVWYNTEAGDTGACGRFEIFSGSWDEFQAKHPHVKASKVSEEVADRAVALSGYEGGPVAFTDGSYLPSKRRGGAGAVLYEGERFDLDAASGDPEPTWTCSCAVEVQAGSLSDSGSAQVAGEFEAVRRVLAEAAARKLPGVTVVYDYFGVAEFFLGLQKPSTPVARSYVEDIRRFLDEHPGFRLRFAWVHSHQAQGTFARRGNALADQLAKEGAKSEAE